MQKRQIPFEVFQTIVETAGLWLVPVGESSDGDSDSVSLRMEYSGRGFASGFGIVLEGSSAIYRFMAAAGQVSAWNDGNDLPTFDVDSLASATETDSMGRSGMIFYWRNWEVTDVPDEFKRD
jgi:hypothetical protein